MNRFVLISEGPERGAHKHIKFLPIECIIFLKFYQLNVYILKLEYFLYAQKELRGIAIFINFLMVKVVF